MSGGCIPSTYVDGSHINRNRRDSLEHYFSALTIEALEVNRGGHQVGLFNDPSAAD